MWKKKKGTIVMEYEIYVLTTPRESKVLFSGIKFSDFIKNLHQPIENLMNIMNGTILRNSKLERGMELFEGSSLVQELVKKDLYNLGNFCLVDYVLPNMPTTLTEQQTAELLYMGHMFKPLHSPFFEELQNRFAYLAHDDGWYCKLYCRNIADFAPVLSGKIKDIATQMQMINNRTRHMNVVQIPDIPTSLSEEILQLAERGLLVDSDESVCESKELAFNLYNIGEYENIDDILNNRQQVKEDALEVRRLSFKDGVWSCCNMS